uniref:Transcription initiation factor TFIID subunit putati n=1 Tax=Albugo laibachii Nc14 TaxID=890382 RepID=F0WVQ9_9STRA|nr:transcription initiation factor TFIID subunit putati [Albugo laibachii Nc14]|eukprot:CCA25505.1 transcription initiation factor TFIID subunit putati [Albugo laibachii Nc14]
MNAQQAPTFDASNGEDEGTSTQLVGTSRVQPNGIHNETVLESQNTTTAAENTNESKYVGSISMENLLVKYLETLGYQVASSKALSDANIDAYKQESASPTAKSNRTEVAITNGALQRSLVEYAKSMGLKAQDVMFNHLLFHGLEASDPYRYEESYGKLMEWICNSLDMLKYELHGIAFPLFVHSYLELILKGFEKEARGFFIRHAKDHFRLHQEEIRILSLITKAEHLKRSEYAQQVIQNRFHIQLSMLSFQLLNAFVKQEQMFLLLSILNTRIQLSVTKFHPGLQIQQLNDADASSVSSKRLESTMSNQITSESERSLPEHVADEIFDQAKLNDSEIGVQITQGEYNMSYLVQAAGGYGSLIEDLNMIPICWGVLPDRKLPSQENLESSVMEDESFTNTSKGGGHNGAPSVPTTIQSGDSNEKKNAPLDISKAATTDDMDPTQGFSNGERSSDTMAIDSNRKSKRFKLGNEGNNSKSLLQEVGPLPDRKSPFFADILEKLVLRELPETKAAVLEDLRVRVSLGKSSLPSSLCFTFLNTSTHITNIAFNGDAALVGASCEDGSFRVWRNDNQPLGTPTGTIDSRNKPNDNELRAIFRGHSNAVYGSSFSPDSRFALTSSADSTIRLWSLAAQSNVVVYRSHSGYPVWDVEYGHFGYYFASCSMDRTARLWSTDHITPLRIYAGHLSDVECVRFHPNHHYIATGSSDKTVRLWDVQSGKCIRIFTGHFHGVKCLAFSRNGRYLTSSGDDQYINIWDLQAGKRLETLVGHSDSVTSLDFSCESSILASGGMDGTVRFWDMQTLSAKSILPFTARNDSTRKLYPEPSSNVGKHVHYLQPDALKNLQSSQFLLKTLRTKQTPVYKLRFTRRNLLLCGGVHTSTE